MATERNVVDFKIHNLTEEQFQKLKAQGKIDPNAVYCTPDDSLKTNQITNCITEIPQDIKLELADGVLTIKAGSKLYYPNGSGVFNEIVLTDDRTYTDTTKTGQWLVCFTRGLTGVVGSVKNSVSGTSQPTAGFSLWYNTEENIMYRYGSITSDPSSNISFPIAIITLNETGVASIDQVFNGFGYIGSTIFALPGVKGLIPNGRNEDGTLKNVEFATSTVLTSTDSSTSTNILLINNTSVLRITATNYFYDEQKNIIINKYNNANAQILFALYGFNKTNNGVVSEFATKTTFHAVDYSDFETLSDTVETLSDTVEINNDNAVHKTGDETISGTKTFTAPSLRISNEAGTGGTGLNILDSNGKGQTYIQHFYTNGRYYSRLANRNATAAKTAYVEVVGNDDGATEFTSYNVDAMYAPTPAASSNGTNIATTAWVRDLFETLYPVGSLYITSTNTTTCPLASIVKKSDGSNSTWSLVSSGRALWTGTGSNGNTTISAGLPNITGSVGAFQATSVGSACTGAFAYATYETSTWGGGDHAEQTSGATFDASRSSSVYRNDVNTVQPPAYVVNVWRRTA